MSRVALPFLTLTDDAIRAGSWLLMDQHGAGHPVSGWIPDWDYARLLGFRRQIIVDLQAASEQLGIPVEVLMLELVVRVGTGAGNMPRSIRDVCRFAITADEPMIEVEALAGGAELSQRLQLQTHVLLAAPAKGNHQLSPQLQGARLWSDSLDLRLDGQEPRFPMEIASFSERFAGRPEASALWYLHWSPGDPRREFHSSVRLFVNSDRPDFCERFVNGDRSTVQTVLADVMNQLVISVLRDQDLEEEFEAGSIGGQVGHWLELAFGDPSTEAVRSMIQLRPAAFHAALLAAADVTGAEVG